VFQIVNQNWLHSGRLQLGLQVNLSKKPPKTSPLAFIFRFADGFSNLFYFYTTWDKQ